MTIAAAIQQRLMTVTIPEAAVCQVCYAKELAMRAHLSAVHFLL